ncbi:MAG TPA: UDP-N-acetylmuramoyl-L-alanine--D-glutamate ligase [bacterium]
MVASLEGKNIHVVGLAGTEGSTVVDFLLARGITTITAHERRSREDFVREFIRTHEWLRAEQRESRARRLLDASIAIQWKERYLEGIDRADVIVVPQSWFRYADNAPLKALRDRGTAFSSMTQLFFEVSPCPIIGVTGTNGKFTVATLIYRMLLASGYPAFFSGNDRTHVPMLYYVDAIRADAWLVLEISNRQLVSLPYGPDLAVVTNVAPHHLDDHGTMEAYVEIKRQLVARQGAGGSAVLNADNEHTRAMASSSAHPFLFSRREAVEPGAFVRDGAIIIETDRLTRRIPLTVIKQPGPHAVENALAATLAATLAGASAPAMAEVLDDFRGLPYRFRIVGEFGGVQYIEDSLATNPTSAAAAIVSLDRPFVLIAGGARPSAAVDDFVPLVDALRAAPARAKAVALIGSTAAVLREALASLGVPVEMAGTLESAVARARAIAGPGDAVLLAPGCESFDQFADYRARGDRFAELVTPAPYEPER